MNISISEAYNKGRIAGTNHYFSLRRDANAVAPKSPVADPFMPVNKEWNRGFASGFDQGERDDLRMRSQKSERR